MRKDITVVAEVRETRGKNEAKRSRVAFKAPAVVYGPGSEPVALTIQPKDIIKILNSSSGHNTIFDLAIKENDQDREHTPAMIVDWQFHPVKTNFLLHCDLKRIDLAKRIKVKVPIQFTGEPMGVKTQGGSLELVTREVEIECLPDDIPERYTVDVSPLLIGQAIRASNLPLEKSAKLVSTADRIFAHVVGTRASEDAEKEAAAGEPEVVKKGKKEEGGDKPAKKK